MPGWRLRPAGRSRCCPHRGPRFTRDACGGGRWWTLCGGTGWWMCSIAPTVRARRWRPYGSGFAGWCCGLTRRAGTRWPRSRSGRAVACWRRRRRPWIWRGAGQCGVWRLGWLARDRIPFILNRMPPRQCKIIRQDTLQPTDPEQYAAAPNLLFLVLADDRQGQKLPGAIGVDDGPLRLKLAAASVAVGKGLPGDRLCWRIPSAGRVLLAGHSSLPPITHTESCQPPGLRVSAMILYKLRHSALIIQGLNGHARYSEG